MDAEYVKEIRRLLGITQKELAEKIGVSLKTITNYETGGVIPDSKIQMLQSLFDLAALNVNVKTIEIDKEGNTTAFDNEGIKYTGKAVPIGGEKAKPKLIDPEVWEVIQLQAKSLAKRDGQIDELIKMLKNQKGVVEGAKSVAPKAALG